MSGLFDVRGCGLERGAVWSLCRLGHPLLSRLSFSGCSAGLDVFWSNSFAGLLLAAGLVSDPDWLRARTLLGSSAHLGRLATVVENFFRGCARQFEGIDGQECPSYGITFGSFTLCF